MDKKEAKIKCSTCGSSFKVRVPVTDKPASFKCKKCGKILKIRVKGSGAGPSEENGVAEEVPNGNLPDRQPEAAYEGNDTFDFGEVNAFDPAPTVPAAPAPTSGDDLIQTGFDFDELERKDYARPAAPAVPAAPAAPAPPPPAPKRPPVAKSEPADTAALAESSSDFHFEAPEDLFVDEPEEEPPPPAPAPGRTPTMVAGAALQATVPAGQDTAKLEGMETTQLPDVEGYQDKMVPPLIKRPAGEDGTGEPGGWMVLSGEVVNGPFSGAEIKDMIGDGEIRADTSLRKGERPWVQAGQIHEFKTLFQPSSASGGDRDGAFLDFGDEEESPYVGTPFFQDIGNILPYPLGGGKWLPFAIFFGTAFVLSTVLCFDLLIGLPLNIIGWVLLYGYLASLMRQSMEQPQEPPPDWDFAALPQILMEGAKVFAVLALFSLVPTAMLLTLTVMFFLNSMALWGYVTMAFTILIFLGLLFLVPAGLTVLASSGNLGRAVNPLNFIGMVGGGGTPYLMLAAFSAAAGLACMAVTIAGVFLTDVLLAGFVVAGLLMGAVFAYANFLWFHVVGRFAAENKGLTARFA